MMSPKLTSPKVYLLLTATILLLTGCAAQQKSAPAASKSYAFWPDAPDEPRIQFLTAFNSSKDLNEKAKKGGLEDMIYGSEPEQSLEISKPYAVRMWNGRVYVCDVRGKGVTVLDLRKKQTRVMGASGAGAVNKAVDVAIAPEGTKYVVDPTQSSIVCFDAEERYLTKFPLPNSSPVGAAVWSNLLYVVDFKAAHVKVLDRATGQLLRTFGEKGGEDGQFIGPLAVAVDQQGNIFVSDPIRARISKFSPEGKFLVGFGQPGDRPGDFVRPKHMGVGADGRIHIVDAAFNNVQVFDPDGRVEGYYGAVGTHLGNMDLPAGLDVHESDFDLFASYVHPAFEVERLILVANQFGAAKISVYAMGHLKTGKTVADIAPTRAPTIPGLVPATQAAPAATQPAVAATTTERRP
jgi:hypothetical protein